MPDTATHDPGDAATHNPGPLRRWALGTYGRLPRRVRLMLLRVLAPSHTVGALCFVEHEGRVLLLRQRHRHGWTLPGGLVDRGENAEQAVVRELREETGLRVEVGVPLAVVVDPQARRVDVLFHVPVEREVEVRPSSEAIDAAWLTPDDAGQVDEPTAEAFALFRRAILPGAYRGRVLDAPAPRRPSHLPHSRLPGSPPPGSPPPGSPLPGSSREGTMDS